MNMIMDVVQDTDEPELENLVDNILQITDAELLVSKFQLDPDTKKTLQIHLFKDVKNVEQIRKNIRTGLWKCAIIKPALIIDPLQIAVAANRAVLAEKNSTMATKSVYTEILYNLSLTKNISQSLSKFGIDRDTQTDMFLCFLTTSESDQDHSEQVLSKIDGEECEMDKLFDLRDTHKIKNMYKIKSLKCDMNLREILQLTISRMVTKNIITY